jgi:hypothetical protein
VGRTRSLGVDQIFGESCSESCRSYPVHRSTCSTSQPPRSSGCPDSLRTSHEDRCRPPATPHRAIRPTAPLGVAGSAGPGRARAGLQVTLRLEHEVHLLGRPSQRFRTASTARHAQVTDTGMVRHDLGTLDLVVQWPKDVPIDRLRRMRRLPVARNPLQVTLPGTMVYLAQSGVLTGRFTLAKVVGPTAVTLLDGTKAADGRELIIQKDSIRVLTRPRRITDILAEPGAPRNPGYPTGFLYLARRPQRFVRTGKQPPPPGPEVVEAGVELAGVAQWIRVSSGQQEAMREVVSHRAEARLVQRYADWLRSTRGRELCRQLITLPGGTTIFSDAFDPARNLLIEAKASCDRPSVRMAIGQLLDYSAHLTPSPDCAILVPSKPDNDLLDLIRSVRIQAIWPTPRGGFETTADG